MPQLAFEDIHAQANLTAALWSSKIILSFSKTYQITLKVVMIITISSNMLIVSKKGKLNTIEKKCKAKLANFIIDWMYRSVLILLLSILTKVYSIYCALPISGG